MIANSSFEHLNYGAEPITGPSMVSSELGMQHQGLVLSLNQFRGSISILNNTFANNIFPFSSCEVLPMTDTDPFLPLKELPVIDPTDDLSLLNRKRDTK